MASKSNPGTGRPSPGTPDEGKPPGGRVTPHDAVFRKTFSVPENAASQLRAVLPAELSRHLDLGSLTEVPGTFVDEDLRKRETDVLWQARFRDGGEAFLYVLTEHQSTSDRFMAFRLVRYIVKIWTWYRERNPKAPDLPQVIPLVIYNGRSRWTAPRRLEDLIADVPGPPDFQKQLAEYRLTLSYLLDDLTAVSEDDLRARNLTDAALVNLVILKVGPGNPFLGELLKRYAKALRAVRDQAHGEEIYEANMAYLLNVGNTPLSDLANAADSLGPGAKETLMTTAEMLEARGEARARADMLLEFLDFRFGSLSDDVTTSVREASSDQLKQWTARAKTVATLDEVFA